VEEDDLVAPRTESQSRRQTSTLEMSQVSRGWVEQAEQIVEGTGWPLFQAKNLSLLHEFKRRIIMISRGLTTINTARTEAKRVRTEKKSAPTRCRRASRGD